EHGFATQASRAPIAFRQDFLEDGERVGRVHLEQPVQRGDSDVVLVVLIGTAVGAGRPGGLRRLRRLRRLRYLWEVRVGDYPTVGVLVPLRRERALNPGEQ